MLPFLQIRNLFKSYKTAQGTIDALKNVSFAIQQGEIFGLLGVNGAGKTTFSSLIATIHPATKSEIFYFGLIIFKKMIKCRYMNYICT